MRDLVSFEPDRTRGDPRRRAAAPRTRPESQSPRDRPRPVSRRSPDISGRRGPTREGRSAEALSSTLRPAPGPGAEHPGHRRLSRSVTEHRAGLVPEPLEHGHGAGHLEFSTRSAWSSFRALKHTGQTWSRPPAVAKRCARSGSAGHPSQATPTTPSLRASRTASFVKNMRTGCPRSAALTPTRNATVTRSESSSPVAKLMMTLLLTGSLRSTRMVLDSGAADIPVPEGLNSLIVEVLRIAVTVGRRTGTSCFCISAATPVCTRRDTRRCGSSSPGNAREAPVVRVGPSAVSSLHARCVRRRGQRSCSSGRGDPVARALRHRGDPRAAPRGAARAATPGR